MCKPEGAGELRICLALSCSDVNFTCRAQLVPQQASLGAGRQRWTSSQGHLPGRATGAAACSGARQ